MYNNFENMCVNRMASDIFFTNLVSIYIPAVISFVLLYNKEEHEKEKDIKKKKSVMDKDLITLKTWY